MMTSPPTPPSHSGQPLRFRIACTAEKCLLDMLRRFITSVAEQIGFGGEDLLKIEMAVDEACSNAFIHAFEDNQPAEAQEIEMRLMIEPDSLTIQIKDFGHAQPDNQYKGAENIEDYMAPDREVYRGLGVLIMKQFMDEVQFLAIPNSGTVVTLRKFNRAAESPASPQTESE